MKCPYCAEDVKDGAIVCVHCRRDLAFFRPVEQRVRALEEQVAALTVYVSEFTGFLSVTENAGRQGREAGFVGAVSKPSYVRVALVLLLQIMLSGGLVAIYGAIQVSILPQIQYFDNSPSANPDEAQKQETERRASQAEDELQAYGRRQRLTTILFLPAIFSIPIALGFWIGIRWRGTHFKRYLLLGVSSGALEVLLFSFFLLLLDDVDMEGGSYLLIVLAINVARCSFGFMAGGMMGDWVEKKVSPRQFAGGFPEKLATRFFERTGGIPVEGVAPGSNLEQRVKGLATAIAAIGPILALLGTIVTSYFGYKATTDAALAAAKNKPSQTSGSSQEQ